MKGWLDKYEDGGELNYNDYSVSAPEGFQGDGYSNVGRNYSPAWGGQFEPGGKLPFEQWYKTVPKAKNDTTTYNLRRAYELAPQDQLDAFVKDPKAHLMSVYENPNTGVYEFMKAKGHPTLKKELDWYNSKQGQDFRNKYNLDTTGDFYRYVPKEMAMGGSMPGAVGFTYARTQSPAPSNGPYAKKTKASAENGKEMQYYQDGLDFKPKTISKNGSDNPKLTNQQMAKKLGLKPAQTVNPVQQANLYVPEIHQNDFFHMSVKDGLNTYIKEPLKQAFDVAANPISALSALNRHGRLPRNFAKGEYSPFDVATGWFNPFSRIEFMANAYQSGKDIVAGQGDFGDYVNAGLGTLTGFNTGKNIVKGVANKVNRIAQTMEFAKQQAKFPNREATAWMKNMYSHPEIKQRMLQNTPQTFVPGGLQPIIDNRTGGMTFQRVPDMYKLDSRTFWNDPVTNPIVNKNYNDLFREKGLKEWLDLYPRSSGVSYGNPEYIYSKVTPFDKIGRESTRVHEATHAMEWNGIGFFPQEEEKLLKPFNLTKAEYNKLPPDVGYDTRYYTDPTEIHARMNQARYLLGHEPGQTFTMEDFDKSMKLNKFNGMGKYIKDPKEFVNLMNTFYQAAPVVGAGVIGAGVVANQPDMKQGGQLTKLNQLTNFTNYNTKQPGGWLNKYEG